MLRIPAISRGLQVMSFMKIPPRLQSTPQSAISSIAFRLACGSYPLIDCIVMPPIKSFKYCIIISHGLTVCEEANAIEFAKEKTASASAVFSFCHVCRLSLGGQSSWLRIVRTFHLSCSCSFWSAVISSLSRSLRSSPARL